MGVLVMNKEWPILNRFERYNTMALPIIDYDIVEYNYQGKAMYRHHLTDRDSANKCFISIMKKIGGFKKAD